MLCHSLSVTSLLVSSFTYGTLFRILFHSPLIFSRRDSFPEFDSRSLTYSQLGRIFPSRKARLPCRSCFRDTTLLCATQIYSGIDLTPPNPP